MTRVLLTGLLVLPLAACGGGSTAKPAETDVAAAPKAGYFVVPDAQLAHVQLITVAKSTWPTALHASGTVDWDNDHTTQAITQVSGPITRFAVDTGDRVAAGDPLLYVTSPDITNALATYRKAKNRLDLAKRTLDRNRDLLAHKAISDSVMEGVQADYNDAATDVQNALVPLKIFGMTAADLDAAEHQDVPIAAELPMRAPLAGTIVQKLVLPGQLIQAGQTLAFVISDTSTVWVQGHVYEKDLPSVHTGDAVEVRAASMTTTFRGTVKQIDSLVDPATRTTLVRIVTVNTDRLLKKDMFVDLTIKDATRRDILAVPVAAVLYDDQNAPFVYLQMAKGQFAERLVTLGVQQGDEVEITNGLKTGDVVVSQGSLFLQFANSFGQ